MEQKVVEIRQGENELRRTMEVLEAKRAETASLGEMVEGSRRQSEHVIENLEFLKHRQEEIKGIGERVDSLSRFLGQTHGRIGELKGKLGSFTVLEVRLGNLDSLILETDLKAQAQVSRQPALDALRARMDDLEGTAQSLESKSRELVLHGERLKELENRLGQVGHMGEEASGLYARILDQKDAAVKQEGRFKELGDSQARITGEFEDTLEKFGQENKAILSEFAVNREKLRALNAEIGAGLHSISGHNDSIKQSEEKLKKVDGVLMTMEQNMANLEKRQSGMTAIEGQIQAVFKGVKEVESRMAMLNQEKSVIQDARRSVESLHVLMKSMQDRIEGLREEETFVARTQESIAGIAHTVGDVEEKFKSLARERDAIHDAKQQIQSLQLMVEDLKIEIRNVSEEEARIQEVAAKVSKLEFLVGEADSAIANLKRLKGKG